MGIIHRMPRRKHSSADDGGSRKPGSPGWEAAWNRAADKIAERYGMRVIIAAEQAMNHPSESELDAYMRAMGALSDADDEEAIDRAWEAWLEPYIARQLGSEWQSRARSVRLGQYRTITVNQLAKVATALKLMNLIAVLERAERRFGEHFKGAEVRIKPKWLRAAVERLRENDIKNYPPEGSRTFADVCGDVAKRFGYAPSATQVKKAAREIKWDRPRTQKH